MAIDGSGSDLLEITGQGSAGAFGPGIDGSRLPAKEVELAFEVGVEQGAIFQPMSAQGPASRAMPAGASQDFARGG